MDNEFIVKSTVFPPLVENDLIHWNWVRIRRFVRELEEIRFKISESRRTTKNKDWNFHRYLAKLSKEKENKMIDFIKFLDTIDDDIEIEYNLPNEKKKKNLDKKGKLYCVVIKFRSRFFVAYHFSTITAYSLRDVIRESKHFVPEHSPRIIESPITEFISRALNLKKCENSVCA